MSAFRFRLTTLLRLRLAERDERRSDLAKALAAAEIVRGQRQSLTAEQEDNLAALRRVAAPGSSNIDRLIHGHRYAAILKAQAGQLAAQQSQIEREVERRRQVLVEADRQVRVLEKLQSRQAAEHQRRLDKLETRQLDEVATIGHFRQRRGDP
ncbi:MAG TPA: flagellar export protein FliJ [Pirellulaceae bacterium]|nr:flagellar export protein FliJ [Pirellulaceae bacterium]